VTDSAELNNVKEAGARVERERNALANFESYLKADRETEQEVLATGRLLRASLQEELKQLRENERAALAAILNNARDADKIRRAANDLRDAIMWKRRTLAYHEIFPAADARHQVLSREVHVAEQRATLAEAELQHHDARLLSILAEAAAVNDGIEVQDGGKTSTLRLVLSNRQRAMWDARRKMNTFYEEIKAKRAAYESEALKHDA